MERKIRSIWGKILDVFIPIWMEMTFKRFFLLALTISVIWTAWHLITHDWTTRAEADQRLGEACLEATKIYLQDKSEITEFLGATFQFDPLGKGREVSLAMIESTEEYDKEKKYSCVFTDNRPWFGYEYYGAPFSFKMDKTEFLAKDAQNANTPVNIRRAVEAAQRIVNPPPETE